LPVFQHKNKVFAKQLAFMKNIFKNPLEKGLTKVMPKIPDSFRWLIFGSLWEGVKIPITELLKNRQGFTVYKEFNKRFSSSIKQKYETALNSNLTREDLEKLKNTVSKRDAVTYQNALISANEMTSEHKKQLILSWQETTRKVLLEELQLIDKTISDEELKAILEGAKNNEINEALKNGK